MTKAKSKNPAYPNADPTAPGGMSQQALADELVEKHGWTEQQVAQFRGQGKVKWNTRAWTHMIDAVAEARLNREAEDKAAACPLGLEGHYLCDCQAVDDNGEQLDVVKHVPEYDIFTDSLPGEIEESMKDPEYAAAFMFEQIEDDTADDFDPDDLMAELLSEREDAAHEPIEYGLLIKSPDTLDYIFDGHYGAGPSASERWMHCTASLGASRAFLETLTPNQQEQFANSNEAARQGTTAHAAAEAEALAILGKVNQDEVDATLLELAIEPDAAGEAYDDEMAEYITEYTDLIRTYAQDRGDDHVRIEQRVSAAVPLTGAHAEDVHEVPGSADLIVLPTDDEPDLVVGDLKYGNGIEVDVEENPQVRVYALGALGLLVNEEGELITNVEDVTYHIVQPRLGGIKTWSEPIGDLLQWRDEVLSPALTAALYGPEAGATFRPSEAACQFCPARGTCPALAEQRLHEAGELFDVIVEAEFTDGPGAFPETETLDDARLGALLAQITGLINIHKDLKAEAERRLYRGGVVPGFHLVNYHPPRKWVEGADDALPFEENPDLWVKKLITPTAAEKLLGDDYDSVKPLVEKPDRRPVIASEGDRRSKWTGKPPEAMFDIEEES